MSITQNDICPKQFNESNIPVLKKNHRFELRKRSKGTEPPDLQKCTETLIKSRNVPQKPDEQIAVKTTSMTCKSSSENKTENPTRIKYNKNHKDRDISKRKLVHITKPKENRTSSFIRSKESVISSSSNNPSFIKSDKVVAKIGETTRENNPPPCCKVDIENFLKKLYPNPYCLDEVKDFQNLKLQTQMWKYKLKDSVDEEKSGQLLNMMFLKITDQPTEEIVVQASEAKSSVNSNNLKNGFINEEVDECEQQPHCAVKMVETITTEAKKNFYVLPEELETKIGDLSRQGAQSENLEKYSITIKSSSYSTAGQSKSQKFIDKHNDIDNTKGVDFSTISPVQKNSKKKSSESISFDNSEDYNLGKLKMLTQEYENREPEKMSEIEKAKKNKHDKKLVKNEEYQMIEISRNLEMMDSKSRSNRYKNKMEVKKLYDIVDKTSKSLQEITTRNEKELMAKQEVERINKQITMDSKFENNKFVQFIKKMHKSQNEKSGQFSGSDPNIFSKENEKNQGKSGKSSSVPKCKRENKSKKMLKEIDEKNNLTQMKETTISGTQIILHSEEKTLLTNIEKDLYKCQKSVGSNNNNNKCNENEGKNCIGVEESFFLNEDIQREETERRQLQFSESNKKIDEMLGRMQEFIIKLDESSSTRIHVNLPRIRCENFECSKLDAEKPENDSPSSNVDMSKGNENKQETLSATHIVSMEGGESGKEKNRRRRQTSSSHLLSVAENSFLGNHQTVENQILTVSESNRMQIVEEANELGGYNEEITSSNGDWSLSKNLLPLSVRIRKRKNDSSEALKKALENEEKLLVNHFLDVPLSSTPTDQFLYTDTSSEPDFFPFRERHSTWKANPIVETTRFFKSQLFDSKTFMEPFKQQNPNFFICVNSLPAAMRTANRSTSFLSGLPPHPFIESGNVNRKVAKEETQQIFTFQSSQVTVEPKTPLPTSLFRYKYEILPVNILQKGMILHSASHIEFKFIYEFSVEMDSHYLQNLDYPIEVIAISVHPDKVEEHADFQNILESRDHLKCSKTIENVKTLFLEADRSLGNLNVGALVETIEKADTGIHKLERINSDETNLKTNSKVLPWHSLSEPFSPIRKKNFQKWDSSIENEKTRVHELLVRTYNLQRKLHHQLHKISAVESLSSRILPKVSLPDLCVLYKSEIRSDEVSFNTNQKSVSSIGIDSKSMQTDPLIPSLNTQYISHSKLVDHGTSYHSTFKEKTESYLFKNTEQRINETLIDKVAENDGGNLDNRSSTSSFKSSKDFSDDKENMAEITRHQSKNQASSSRDFKNFKFLRKIFSDLEIFRKSQTNKKNINEFKEEKRKDADLNRSFEEGVVDLVKDPIVSSKMLKTIFKGKDSTTELAIGLRDVPMSNISVEKKKLSPNHTKISISISKEGSNKQNLPVPDTKFRTTRYQDKIEKEWERLPVTCRTLQNEEASDNEDDDFKSVVSSFSQDSISFNVEDNISAIESKPIPKGTEPSAQNKPYRKHRFDFYQKMSTDYNSEGTDGLLTRYDVRSTMFRELEPLQKALTDMQIRMRTIKRNSLVTSNEYYDRALKLAKMSAGYCQSCGNRAVIPEDTFGYYKSVLPGRYSTHQLKYFLKNTGEANSGFYSFRSSTELSDHICDLDLNQSSTYLMNSRLDNSVLERSLNNLSFCYERAS